MFDIDDVLITNFEATGDEGTSAIQNVSQETVKYTVNKQSIEVFGENVNKYEIVNFSGQTISSGLLNGGKAQFKNTINDGLYLVKFTKLDGTIVAGKFLVR